MSRHHAAGACHSQGVTWLRYTIYLIHGDIYHRNVQDEWIDFLYRGLSNPDDPTWDVLKEVQRGPQRIQSIR